MKRENLPTETRLDTDDAFISGHIQAVAYAPKRGRIRSFLVTVINSNLFGCIVGLIIILNTIILAMERYPQPPKEDRILEVINLVITITFTVEMAVKVFALGARGYFREKLNFFDAAVVVMSGAELIAILANPNSTSNSGALSVFRAFRLIRILKLVGYWESFGILLVNLFKSLKDISYFTILLFLFNFIYSVLGMEFFAFEVPLHLDKVGQDAGPFRVNFDTFFHSMVSVFVLLTGDNWSVVMQRYALHLGRSSMLYFVTLTLVGRLILLNLFLALLIKTFEENYADLVDAI